MQYSNFDMKNNVHATLSTAISSVATTIQLTSWQWSRFWTTFPQIATLESIENWKVMKREIVKITWRSGDNLTVVRAFAPCPSNDDANSQSQSAISFNADDTISLYIPKEIFDKIRDSLNDIYDNGTNNLRTELVSWLEVEVNAWSVLVWSAYYDFAGWTITLTDNATNYLEIDEDWNLANNTSDWNEENTKLAIITTSGGSVTNIKDRRLWTVWWKIGGVNIHELTEKMTLNANDEFIIADSESIYQNKKIKAEKFLWLWTWVAVENITKWKFIFEEDVVNHNWANWQYASVWHSQSRRIAIKRIWNGVAFNTLTLNLLKYWSPTRDLNVEIQTDNAWNPSWTLIDANAHWTILASSVTTSVSTITVNLAWSVTIPDWTVCHVVLYTTSTSSANFYEIYWRTITPKLFRIKQYNWSVRSDWTNYNPYFDVSALKTNNITLFNTSSQPIYSFWVNETWKKFLVWLQQSYIREYSYSINTNNVMSGISETTAYNSLNRYIFCWNSSWTKAIVKSSSDTVLYNYTLSTARNPSTWTSSSNKNMYNVDGINTRIYTFYVSPDWTKIFRTHWQYIVYRWTMSTAWDISTVTYGWSKQLWSASSSYSIYWITFSPDWKYVYCWNPQYIRAYLLSTAWDLSWTVSSAWQMVWYNSASANTYWMSWVNWTLLYWNYRSSSSNYMCQAIDVKKRWYETLLPIRWNWLYTIEYWLADKSMSFSPYSPKASVWNYNVWQKVKYNICYNENVSTAMITWQKYYLWTAWWIQTSSSWSYEIGVAVDPTVLRIKQTY